MQLVCRTYITLLANSPYRLLLALATYFFSSSIIEAFYITIIGYLVILKTGYIFPNFHIFFCKDNKRFSFASYLRGISILRGFCY